MIVELDQRPVDNSHAKPYFAIRLYPENNKDITDMKWGLSVKGDVSKIMEASVTKFHWVICFRDLGTARACQEKIGKDEED